MNAQSLYIERREHERKEVEWNVLCSFGKGSLISGTLRDWSEAGMFFEPSCGCMFGSSYDAEGIVNLICDDDDIEVVVLQNKDNTPETVSGVVRWVGYSQAHKCLGFGIERE